MKRTQQSSKMNACGTWQHKQGMHRLAHSNTIGHASIGMQYRDQGRQACTHSQVMRAAIACAGTCNNKRIYAHAVAHIPACGNHCL